MDKTSVTIEMDAKVKDDLRKVLDDIGLNMNTFFVLAAKQAILEQDIPFEVSIENYNEQTLQAIYDDENGIGLYGPFSSVAELMQALESDD